MTCVRGVRGLWRILCYGLDNDQLDADIEDASWA